MAPLGKLAISGWPRLAVIQLIWGWAGIDVELPPLTGYSVSSGPGSRSAITLSGPYQVSEVLNSGTVVVDTFVMTNACAHFVRTGGTLIYKTAVLDPNADADGDGIPNGYEQAHGLDPLNPADASLDNDGDGFSNLQEYLAGTDPNSALSTPFRVTSIVEQGSNIVLAWTTSGGTTSQVQVTQGTGNGSYSTNGFANLGSQMVISGSGLVATNFTDVGGATNKPARYYRVRLVP